MTDPGQEPKRKLPNLRAIFAALPLEAAPLQRSPDATDADDAPLRALPDTDTADVIGTEAGTTDAEATETADAEVLARSRRHTRRAFLGTAVASAAGYGFYRWIDRAHPLDMLSDPLRRSLQINAALSRGLFDDRALAPTYPLSRSETLRVNGIYGLKKALDPDSYRLQVVGVRNASAHPRYAPDVTAWRYRYSDDHTRENPGHDTKLDPKLASSAKMAPAPALGKAQTDENHTGRKPRGSEEAGESYSTLDPGTPGLLLTLDDLTRLPRHELVTQFRCIEGWSQIVHWAGVRMADFLEAYPPAPVNGKEPRYVYMETPDGDYYTGYDVHVCRHPQTLLVTEMMGTPLTQLHGAPLRLHMPTKYGYKQIKRIGLIAYTNEKPDDYWTELGYDWYAGL